MTTRNGLDLGLQYRNGVALPDSAALAGTVVVVDSTGTNLAFTGVALSGLGDFDDGTVDNEYLGWDAATSTWKPTGSVPFASGVTEYAFANGAKLTTAASGAVLVFDPASGTVSAIRTADGASAVDSIAISPGDVTSSGTGSALSLYGGATASGTAGSVNVQGGIASSGTGGAAFIQGGSGSTVGGNATLRGGAVTTGVGGTASVIGGDSNDAGVAGAQALLFGGENSGGVGGNAVVSGGIGSTDGGHAIISGGTSSGSGDGGDVLVYPGDNAEFLIASGSTAAVSLRASHSSSDPTLGFFGKSPVAQAAYSLADPVTETRAIRAELIRLGLIPAASGAQRDSTYQGNATTVPAASGAPETLCVNGSGTTIAIVTGWRKYRLEIMGWDGTDVFYSVVEFAIRSTGTGAHALRIAGGSEDSGSTFTVTSTWGSRTIYLQVSSDTLSVQVSRDTNSMGVVATLDVKVLS